MSETLELTSTETAAAARRQMDRIVDEVAAIRDDVEAGEFDGARAHLEILKRRLADLDEKLITAARTA